MSNCSGQCCTKFCLGEAALDTLTTPDSYWKEPTTEYEQVRDMVIELEWHDSHVYCTCKNFDTETRRCIIYEDRPNMCRTHGEGKNKCTYEGCTI